MFQALSFLRKGCLNVFLQLWRLKICIHQCELLWSARSRRWSSEQPIKRRACNRSLFCCDLCGWMAIWSSFSISMWFVISLNGSNFIGCNLNTCTLFLLHVLHFKYHYCPNFEPFGVAFLMPEIFYWSLCFLLLFLCLLFVLKQQNCIIPNILDYPCSPPASRVSKFDCAGWKGI